MLPEIERRVEELREQVLDAGGLFIIGTERHESRRIDNQLRGRSGRQGDPGESRFFLSAQDDLVRLFAGERIYKILDRLGTIDEEGNEEPIEAGMLSKQIEKAQRKVEEQHFLQRKHTLEYDDVLNQQRDVIYTYRDEVLEGRDMSDAAREEVVEVIERLVEEYTAGDFVEDWDVEGLLRRVEEIFPPSAELLEIDPNRVDREELTAAAPGGGAGAVRPPRAAARRGADALRSSASCCCRSSTSAGASTCTTWTTCARASTCAGSRRSSRWSRTRTRPSTLFRDLMNSVWGDFARMIFHVEVTVEGENGGAAASRRGAHARVRARRPAGGNVSYSGGTGGAAGRDGDGGRRAAPALPGAERTPRARSSLLPPSVEQRRVDESQQLGRNDPCWCGSGKKFKKCHGA